MTDRADTDMNTGSSMGVVWITGAGKGIGRAVALRYAAMGWTVIASARTESDLRTLHEEARDCAGSIDPLVLDVTDADACKAAVSDIRDLHGDIDMAILNAGTHKPFGVDAFSVEAFRGLVEVNLMGMVHGLAAVMPRMIERHCGRIVVVASVSGYGGLPNAGAYGATKAALINLCEALKPELDVKGVGLTLVNPGFVKTPLTDQNDFEMPFLMPVEAAAKRMVDGIERGTFEVTFPRRFTWMLKLMRLLPYPLYFALTRRLLKD